MNANIRTIGGSIGAAVTSVMVTGHLQASGLPYGSGYTHGFALLAVLLLGAALAALLVPARRAGRGGGTTVGTSESALLKAEEEASVMAPRRPQLTRPGMPA